MVEEYVKDNYYARFHAYNYHCYRKIHFSARVNTTRRECLKVDGL